MNRPNSREAMKGSTVNAGKTGSPAMIRCAAIFALILAVPIGSCNKRSTEPVPPKAEIVYATTEKSPTDQMYRIYYIDTETDSVVDSILRPGAVGVAYGVSPDGTRLYMNDGVIDTRTKETIPGALTGIPTPDGRYLINSSITPDTLQVIDARTNEILFTSDTMSLINIGPYSFDTGRGLVYGAIYDTARQIARRIGVFDYLNYEMVRVINPTAIGGLDILVHSIAVSQDGKKLFYSSEAGSPYFTCIDLERDTVECLHLLNGSMTLALTDDNERLFFTDPGGYYIIGYPPSGLIQIYRPPSGTFDTPIDITAIPNPCDSIVLLGLTDQIAIHPNDRKAYLTMYDNFSLMVIDIPADTVRKVLCGFGFVRSITARR